MVSQEYAVGRIRELRDWADYIVTSLTEDQEWEQGNVQMIRHLLGGTAPHDKVLEEARRLSESLSAVINQTV